MMKSIACSLALTMVFHFVYAQDKELEAQYSYAQAEEQYSKTRYPDAISLCERAAEKLGATNQKILFLELESYDGLLKKQCRHELLADHNKIERYISLYLDTLGKNADRQKIFTIMKFRENWNIFKEKGCFDKKPPPYSSLGLGLILDSYTNSFVPHRTMFTHKKTEYKVPRVEKLDGGGLFATKTTIKTGFRIFSMTISTDPSSSAASSIREDLRAVEGAALPALVEKDIQTLLNNFPDITAIKIKLAGHYSGDKYESEEDVYEVGVRVSTGNE